MPLSSFHPIIESWFRRRFGSPTDVQTRSWPVIAAGGPVLIAAPTGSGKTLAAFLAWDRKWGHSTFPKRQSRSRVWAATKWKSRMSPFPISRRRMELRGEIRGGRFVSGFTGEQFALPEALEALRMVRREAGGADQRGGATHDIKLSATDPLNLVGVILPGSRIPALLSNYVVFRDGLPVRAGQFRESGKWGHSSFPVLDSASGDRAAT